MGHMSHFLANKFLITGKSKIKNQEMFYFPYIFTIIVELLVFIGNS